MHWKISYIISCLSFGFGFLLFLVFVSLSGASPLVTWEGSTTETSFNVPFNPLIATHEIRLSHKFDYHFNHHYVEVRLPETFEVAIHLELVRTEEGVTVLNETVVIMSPLSTVQETGSVSIKVTLQPGDYIIIMGKSQGTNSNLNHGSIVSRPSPVALGVGTVFFLIGGALLLWSLRNPAIE